MYSIQQVIERYKPFITEKTVTGYLRFGGHSYYLKDSEIPRLLNSDGWNSEFISNDKGQLQEYSHTTFRKKWGQTIDKYYLHPWFPDEKISAIQVIRLIPGLKEGDLLKVEYGNKLKQIQVFAETEERHIKSNTIGSAWYSLDYCLEYPEFFKPIYENTFEQGL